MVVFKKIRGIEASQSFWCW